MSRPSILPSGMRLVGDVQGNEDLVIFGTVEGQVTVEGAVVVETSGTVRGNVKGRTVAVRGVVLGDASAFESIRVDDGGRMVGDVHAPRVNIVKGARFRGHVHMTEGKGAPREQPAARTRSRRRRRGQPAHARPQQKEAAGTEASVASPMLGGEGGPTVSDTPTVPGSVRALHPHRTAPLGAEAKGAALRPPVPSMPALRRTRAIRRDAPPRED